ncbi:hypothetical protein ACO0OL_002796 [Hanseniaspora opuntiae]
MTTTQVSIHHHIKNLKNDNFIGQEQAKQATSIILDLIKEKKFNNKGLLIQGQPSTGKTALAYGMTKELGANIPFIKLVGSEFYSKEVKPTELLMMNLRRGIIIRMKELKEVYEGEVIELQPEESNNTLGQDIQGYGKSLSHVVITLKAAKGTKTLRLDPTIYDSIVKEKIAIGDVIYIEANTGIVKRCGRSDSFATEFDLELEEYVPLPKGEVYKKREIIQDLTLHDLDMANVKPSSNGNDIISMMSNLQANKKTEITDKLRQEVDKVVHKYISNNQAELIPGVLFIDEAHMLNLEMFTYINKILELDLAPLIILATNKQGLQVINGTDDISSPFGIPQDLLDRCLIIKTKPYNIKELEAIINKRAQSMTLKINPSAMQALCQIGDEASKKRGLRYALQLLSPCSILMEIAGRDEIIKEDVEECMDLFLDLDRSVEILKTNTQGFL